jgi:hypothetical protein
MLLYSRGILALRAGTPARGAYFSVSRTVGAFMDLLCASALPLFSTLTLAPDSVEDLHRE